MAALRSSIRHRRVFSTTTTTTTTTNSPFTSSAAKSKLRSEHDPDKALEIYNTLTSTSASTSTSPMASRYVQGVTVKRLARSRRFEDIEKLIDSHKLDPNITQENYYSSLIRSYGVAGMPNHAFKLYNHMDDFGTPRTAISFNALLTAYNASKKFDQVPKLFDEIIEKYRFSPDKISYGILIKSYCELSLPESAFTVIKEMEKKGVEVTTVCYTTILDALYKKGKVEEAEKLWKSMVEKGCKLDVCAYNVKIMHAYNGKPEDVLGIINEITAAGLKPDTITYNYLYSCYCKNGRMGEAKKVIKEIEEKGLYQNAATFRLQILYLCKNEEFVKAYGVFKVSVQKDKVPSFGTMKMLAEGLVKIGKKKEAKGLFRTVRKKYPANYLKAWDKLQGELGLDKEEPSPTKQVEAAASA